MKLQSETKEVGIVTMIFITDRYQASRQVCIRWKGGFSSLVFYFLNHTMSYSLQAGDGDPATLDLKQSVDRSLLLLLFF